MKLDADWLARHEDILRRILAKSTGAIAELWVAKKLEEAGYRVRATDNNARQSDLLVSKNGVGFSIEVKGVRSGAPWLVQRCPDPNASQYWVFVYAPRAPHELPDEHKIEAFVLTTEEAAEIWRSTPRNATSTMCDIRQGPVRRGGHLNAWNKLPCWEGPA